MNAKKGFTLIEIMIVVAIIAILAAVAIPNFIAYRQTSQLNACKANIKTIQNACEAYIVANGDAPANLDALTTSASGKPAIMKSVPTCPFAKATYNYTKPDAGAPCEVTCPSASDVNHKDSSTSTTEEKKS